MINGASPNQLAKMSSGDTPECKEKVFKTWLVPSKERIEVETVSCGR